MGCILTLQHWMVEHTHSMAGESILYWSQHRIQHSLYCREGPLQLNESTSNSATQFSAFAFGIPEEVSFKVYTLYDSDILQCEATGIIFHRLALKSENFRCTALMIQMRPAPMIQMRTSLDTLSQVNGTYNVSDGDTEAELTRQDQDTIIAYILQGSRLHLH